MPEPGSEFARIAALLAGLPSGEGVIVGPGDDAAVLRPREGRDLVATTDAFVEGRHFRRYLLTSAEAGVRLAAANLSDLAAMAAEPRWALLSLVVPGSWTQAECQLLERACARTLAASGAAIVGGNLASGEGAFSATLVLLGDVERDRAWKRAGAKPGDVLAVTGMPGSAAAFLALALWGNPPSRARVPHDVVERVVVPAPRVTLARALAATGGVRAAIDVSDGLAADLAHLCAASGTGARIDEGLLPGDEALRAAARALSAHAGQERGPLPAAEGEFLTRLQLGASDDYELLLAIAPEGWVACEAIAQAQGVPLTRVGEITAGDERVLRTTSGDEHALDERGWDHFRNGS
jgi:thiamine-monophosphate kinase